LNGSNPTTDLRLERLRHWLTAGLLLEAAAIEPASADASFRRYFRVTLADGATRIVMDAPPDKEDVTPFLRVAAMLADIGVHAPRVLARDEAQGFLLLTDLGSRMYLPELPLPGQADALYQDAIAALIRIQAGGAQHTQQLPAYDETLLRFEMSLFPDWLLARHLQLQLSGTEVTDLARAMDALVRNAVSQPQVFVHRDYHSRNLMICPGDNPGILDFQDAVHGPLTYDLVSLLRDAYIEWPQSQVERWALSYRNQAIANGLYAAGTEADFLRWFDLMGLQRQLKVAGIFARLWHRDGKQGYLADIPRTLGYAASACARHPEFAALGELIRARVLPAVIADLDANPPR